MEDGHQVRHDEDREEGADVNTDYENRLCAVTTGSACRTNCRLVTITFLHTPKRTDPCLIQQGANRRPVERTCPTVGPWI